MTDLTILQGDCRDKLRELPAASVHCAVTSPPYFGLRDYGTAQWEGGSAECDHLAPPLGGIKASGLNAKRDEHGYLARDGKSQPNLQHYRNTCGKCGARRIDQQIGLERTPDEYVANLVEVFRDVKRVLRDDGTLWLNLGDSYANDGKWGGHTGGKHAKGLHGSSVGRSKRYTGLKPKDLIGIPWLVAFALRADGWYLRQDIIWSKPNPMPESVTDRCTKAHEYLFLLSKSEQYFYDQDAIKEPMIRGDAGSTYTNGKTAHHQLDRASQKPRTQRKPAGWDTGDGAHGSYHRNGRADVVEHTEEIETTRNKRSVWTVPTFGFPEAHFATYPPALIKPCILAGSPAGGVVLDPFGGSGTTGKVALELGRSAILIELNPDYVKLIEKRCRVNLPLMFEVAQ